MTDDNVNCIACGLAAGFNRVVVRLATKEELGGLCMNCERAGFGRRLELLAPSNPEQCSFCAGSPTFAIPKWTSEGRLEDGTVRSSVSYSITAATVRLCREHFEELHALPDANSSSASGPDRR